MNDYDVSLGRRILVVDDNLPLLRTLCCKLEVDGFLVTTACSGDEALAMLQNGFVPDALLTDAVMPGRTQGSELARLSKKHYPDVPVIMMSAYAGLDDCAKENTPEVDCFFAKPLKLSELSAELQQRLGYKQ